MTPLEAGLCRDALGSPLGLLSPVPMHSKQSQYQAMGRAKETPDHIMWEKIPGPDADFAFQKKESMGLVSFFLRMKNEIGVSKGQKSG